MDIETLAVRAGRAAWVEQRAFEMLGAWVTTTPDATAKRLFAAHCHQHVWHAELWRERLPVLRHLPAESLIAPADDAVARLIADIGDLTDPGARVSAFYGVVLPCLVEAYTAWQQQIDPLVDAPTARVLRLVLADETAALLDGETLAATLGAEVPDDQRLSLATSILG